MHFSLFLQSTGRYRPGLVRGRGIYWICNEIKSTYLKITSDGKGQDFKTRDDKI